MTTRFSLFTLNYPKFQPQMGTPVRTSNGHPRFVKYPLPHKVPELYPDRATMSLPKDQFRVAYHEKLARSGVDTIASRFRAIVVAEDEPRLVVMCFEDITKGDKWCHRTMFAEWWTEQTGDPVIELGPAPTPAPRLEGLF